LTGAFTGKNRYPSGGIFDTPPDKAEGILHSSSKLAQPGLHQVDLKRPNTVYTHND